MMIVFNKRAIFLFQRAQQSKTRQHGPSVVLICVKMASVMGVTWIFGIAANLEALSFLWYPYVVLNSLQGTFSLMNIVLNIDAFLSRSVKITTSFHFYF